MNEPAHNVAPYSLGHALRDVARDLHTLQPPPMSQRLRDAVRAAGAPRAEPPARRVKTRAWAAVACCCALVGSVVLMLQPPRGARDEADTSLQGFVALVPTDRWPAGTSAAWLVNAELPSERLAALGLPYDPGRAGDRLPAQLLMHPSGEVLAVRVLR